MQLAFHSHHENVSWGRLAREEIHDIVHDRWFWGVLVFGLLAAALAALVIILGPTGSAPSGSPTLVPYPYGVM